MLSPSKNNTMLLCSTALDQEKVPLMMASGLRDSSSFVKSTNPRASFLTTNFREKCLFKTEISILITNKAYKVLRFRSMIPSKKRNPHLLNLIPGNLLYLKSKPGNKFYLIPMPSSLSWLNPMPSNLSWPKAAPAGKLRGQNFRLKNTQKVPTRVW